MRYGYRRRDLQCLALTACWKMLKLAVGFSARRLPLLGLGKRERKAFLSQPHCCLHLDILTLARALCHRNTHARPPDCPTDAQLLATPQAIRQRASNGPLLRVFSHGRLHWLTAGHRSASLLSPSHPCARRQRPQGHFVVAIHRCESHVRLRVSARFHGLRLRLPPARRVKPTKTSSTF